MQSGLESGAGMRREAGRRSTPGARPKLTALIDGPHGRLQIGTKRAKEGVLTCSSGFGLRTASFPLAPGHCLLTQRAGQKEELCRREAY